MNNSFFDATPDNHGTLSKFGKVINQDYSVNQFNKKKTLSKAKLFPDNHQNLFEDQNLAGVVHSPFGPVSPMPNQHSKSR